MQAVFALHWANALETYNGMPGEGLPYRKWLQHRNKARETVVA